MSVHVDEKGKYFTPHVSKETINTLIRTTDEIIIGELHIRPEQRITDALKTEAPPFIPITNAHIYCPKSEELQYQSHFLLVAYHQIIWMSPLDELHPTRSMPWKQHDKEQS